MKRFVLLMLLLLLLMAGCASEGGFVEKPKVDETPKETQKQQTLPEQLEKQESPAEDFVYEMKDGEVTITGYKGTDREIYIPKEINDRPVTTIAKEAFVGYDMTLLDMPNSVRVICEDAFYDCNCLVDLRLSEGLERIERYAFNSCDALENVTLPESLEFLGYGSFANTAVKKLMIPYEFAGFDIEKSVLSTEIDENGAIHQTVGDVLQNPIYNCDAVLAVVDDSEALKLVRRYGYGKIDYIVVNKAGKPISGMAYSFQFHWLESGGGYEIEYYVGNDEKVVIPDQIEGEPVIAIGQYAFKETEIKEVHIPDDIQVIGAWAFYSCSNLDKVVFEGDANVRLAMNSFADCSQLLELELPPSACFSYKWEQIWNEEQQIYISLTSETKIELPFDEDDATIMVVQRGSKVHEILMADEDVQDKYRVE